MKEPSGPHSYLPSASGNHPGLGIDDRYLNRAGMETHQGAWGNLSPAFRLKSVERFQLELPDLPFAERREDRPTRLLGILETCRNSQR